MIPLCNDIFRKTINEQTKDQKLKQIIKLKPYETTIFDASTTKNVYINRTKSVYESFRAHAMQTGVVRKHPGSRFRNKYFAQFLFCTYVFFEPEARILV